MLSKIRALIFRIFINNKLNKIKRTCFIGNNVTIFKETDITNQTGKINNVAIGENSAINGNIILYANGNKIVIGSNTYIGINTRIWAMGTIEIGDNVLIAHNVNIFDNNSHSTDINIRKNEFQYILKKGYPNINLFKVSIDNIKINNGAWIGMNSIILKGVEIGENSIIAAGSVVTKNVPPNTVVAGNPAKFIKKLDTD